MFTAACTHKPGDAGLIFLPSDADADHCDLRVTFRPIEYYEAEPENGADADFDAAIVSIEIRDIDEADPAKCWHTLTGADELRARAFLDKHHSAEMWAQAEIECAEAFGVDISWKVAA